MQGDMDAWVMPPKMSAFSRIVCNGSVRLFIDGAEQEKSGVHIYSTEVEVMVDKGTLYLSTKPEYWKKVSAVEHNVFIKGFHQMAGLEYIGMFDNSSLHASHMHSKFLYLESITSGNVSLGGVIGLKRLSQLGSGNLDIYWAKAPSMDIEASSGSINIAGFVKQGHFRLSGDVKMDASKLEIDDIWISSVDSAESKIFPRSRLSAFGQNASKTIYLHYPKLLNTIIHDAGLIAYQDHQ